MKRKKYFTDISLIRLSAWLTLWAHPITLSWIRQRKLFCIYMWMYRCCIKMLLFNQESYNLHTVKKCMRGQSKGDSMIILYNMQVITCITFKMEYMAVSLSGGSGGGLFCRKILYTSGSEPHPFKNSWIRPCFRFI